ncbi:MAG: DNRLRE domain-containing protein [Acidobacteriota bacterium]
MSTNRASLAVLALALSVASGRAQTTGFTPLNDLGAGQYQGFQGGLYTGGVNLPPPAHAAAALAASQAIVPRDGAGNPDPDGLIGFVAIGMSNTTHEFSVFERQEDRDGTRNAQVVILDTAFGGQDATIIKDPTAMYWTLLDQKLTAMGMTAAQVQVAWLKEAQANPPNNFPLHAQSLRDDLETIEQILHDRYPNLVICYLSSRIFGGYATGGLNPEPQAYEGGFSVKWLIEDQISGDPGLNWDPARGTVESPLLLWGPYLWADGVNPRSDGLVWLASDLEADGTHPAPSGEQKVADMLSAFFPGEPSSQSWWWARPGRALVAIDATDDAHVQASNPGGNYGASPTLYVQGGAQPMRSYLMFDASASRRPALLAKLSLRIPTTGGGLATGQGVASTSWSESTITYANAPALGATVCDMPQASRDGSLAGDVTTWVNSDADGVVAIALTTAISGQGVCTSKEGGAPPDLALVLERPFDFVVGDETPASPPRVRVYDAQGNATSVDFTAYGAGQYGVTVASGDVDGGLSEILTGPGPGPVYGPQVRAFDRTGSAIAKVNFYAYGTLKYGAKVERAGVDSDPYDEILTAPGPGAVFGPHVRGFNYDGASVSAIAKISFFAYGTLRYGVNARAGSVDLDSWDEIVTGPGPGVMFGSQVRGFDYDASTIASIGKINFNAFAYAGYGANLAAGDVDRDLSAEIAAAPGPGPTHPARFAGFNYDGATLTALPGYDITPFTSLQGGRVDLCDFDRDDAADLVAKPGDFSMAPRVYAYGSGSLSQLPSFLPVGVAVAGGDLAY